MPAEGGAVRVLLVDDHEVVREGLRTLLASKADRIQVAGEAGTVAEAVEQAARLQPDVVVLDVRLPDGSGVEACREIRSQRPQTGVLMLTSFSDDEALVQSIMAGAAGYLLKHVRGAELVAAIETVSRGGALLDPAVTGRVLERLRKPETDAFASLTETERRILELIAEGKTNREIGEAVFLSEKTVKHYVSSILSKLEVSHRSEAAAKWARRVGGRNAQP
jgi:two-component system response regulator DevR